MGKKITKTTPVENQDAYNFHINPDEYDTTTMTSDDMSLLTKDSKKRKKRKVK
ncbi:MAG: hypothetical protein ACOYVK_17995 [Bacillota bacterium]